MIRQSKSRATYTDFLTIERIINILKKAYDAKVRKIKAAIKRECTYNRQAYRYREKSRDHSAELGFAPLLNLDDLLGNTAQRYLEKRKKEEEQRNNSIKALKEFVSLADLHRVARGLTLSWDRNEHKWI